MPPNENFTEKAGSDVYPGHEPVRIKKPTLYDPIIVKNVKTELNRIWERVKSNNKLTQAQLAAALSTSQSAVSKLLKIDDTHPWTAKYIITFCEFCQVDLEEEILPQLPIGIRTQFQGWNKNINSDETFTQECTNAVRKYFVDKGIQPKSEQVVRLVAQLVLKLNRRANLDEMQKAIENVVLEAALRGQS